MGVQGLVPFLQKVCPDVIRELPNRLQALRGKTVVLDATLITMRFHFTNIPHDRRHILGWHRLLYEFRQNGVGAICVFDGRDRIVAKRAEHIRRKGLRDLALARSNIEQNRALRLRGLQCLLPPTSPEVSLQAKLSRSGVTPHAGTSDGSPGNGKPRSRLRRPPEPVQLPEYDAGELIESLGGLAIEEPVTPHSTEDLAGHLDTLYRSYVDELEFLTTEEPMVTGNTDIDSEVESAEITVSLTRSQREVGEGERQIWIALSEGTEFPELASEISDLADRSETICHSYRRTAELPGEATFSESRMMIEAMGVPWIECGAEFEAEAFASSIVLHDLADYVASEDTDVLLYQAPLLRNITTQSEPLILIFGSEIPQKLAISTSSFVDFAILIGTDFSPRLKGLGPHRALKLIKSYGNLEDALAGAPRYSPTPRHLSSEYLERARIARQIFTTLPPPPSPRKLKARTSYDEELVAEILDQYGLTRLVERMDGAELKATHGFDEDYYKSTLGSGGFD